MCGYRVPRKAGWDCHGLPVELEVEKQLGISSKAEIEAFGIAEFNAALPRVGLHLRRGVEPADRADRLLDRPRRPLRDARERLHRVGLVGAAQDLGRRPPLHRPQGRALLPALRHRALLARGLAAATGTSSTRRSSCGCRSTAVAPSDERPESPLHEGDSLLVWTTTPWTLISNAAVAAGAGHRVRAGRAPPAPTRSSSSRPSASRRVVGEGAEVLATFPGETLAGTALRAALPLRLRLRPAGPHRPARRLRHHRRGHGPRPHRDRLRRGRLPAGRAVRDQAAEPGPARRHLRRPRRAVRRQGREGGRPGDRRGARASPAGSSARRATSTPTRTAGAARRRSSTTRSRAGTSRRPTSATGCSPRTRRSAGTRSTSSTAGSASGSRATSTGRSRASATGARRCRSGSASPPSATERFCAGSVADLRERGGEVPDDLHRPYIDDVVLSCARVRRRDAPHARGDRHLVRLGRDAVRAVPLPVRARVGGALRRALPRRLHLRGDRPDPRLVLLAARRVDAALRPRRATSTASASA